MGLFGQHSTDSTTKNPASSSNSTRSPRRSNAESSPTESRRSGLFGSKRNESPSTTASVSSGGIKHTSSLLHRNREDPSISAAREQVTAAEGAEKAADKALVAARQAVKDAKDHVKKLEKEAAEDARLARIKQDQAASISKRAMPLGRHGN